MSKKIYLTEEQLQLIVVKAAKRYLMEASQTANNTNSAALIVSERESLPYGVIYNENNLSDEELREKGKIWIRNYIKKYGYNHNPFYVVILPVSEIKNKKNLRRLKVE